ncbi:uncharacterized protein LOC141618932 [Silene latifolia]|uniref:uncharacterized protein LOC141618932 n=1 Tax=Silene latifolia TaxID=37657 RepID=UPI003D7804D0
MKESPSLVAWEHICKPLKQGGLGIKDLHCWNIATIGKYAWWVANKEDHLWVRWVHAIYIKQHQWQEYKPGIGSSWAWRKICQAKDRLQHLIFPPGSAYSIKDGYKWLKPDSENVPWYPWMLNKWILPKHSFLCWLVARGRLLTQDRLVTLGVLSQNVCYLCGLQEESHQHLFFECIYSMKCIRAVSAWCMVELPHRYCIQWWIEWRQSSLCRKKIVAVILACSMYQIWYARNICRLEGYLQRPGRLGQCVKQDCIRRMKNLVFKCKNSRVMQWIDNILY